MLGELIIIRKKAVEKLRVGLSGATISESAGRARSRKEEMEKGRQEEAGEGDPRADWEVERRVARSLEASAGSEAGSSREGGAVEATRKTTPGRE